MDIGYVCVWKISDPFYFYSIKSYTFHDAILCNAVKDKFDISRHKFK